MMWTTPQDLRAQVQKLWDKGRVLSSLAGGEALFPRKLAVKKPSSAEMGERFEDVREWIAGLRASKYIRVTLREVNHRVLGANAIPDEAWIDSLDDAVALLGKQKDVQRFSAQVAFTRDREPALMPWIERYPFRFLEVNEQWPLLLDVIAWMKLNPRPGIYLRQIDLPGIHSKFIEAHRALLMELLELVLPPDSMDKQAIGVGNFCRRFGFRDKPLRIRFRCPAAAVSLPVTGDVDLTVDQATFGKLAPAVSRVFITENEVNFLAFPLLPQSMVLFGAGYGFEMLADAAWLHQRSIIYWGDIDTHGLAILSQLRAYFPDAQSLLMDRETLLAHESSWGTEPKPERRELPRLTAEERSLYEDLRFNRLGMNVRLEQERIRFDWLSQALGQLAG